jgi:hypothetical protein
MAIGATSRDVQRLVLREGLRTTVWGLGAGALLALAVGKLVSGLLYPRQSVRSGRADIGPH